MNNSDAGHARVGRAAGPNRPRLRAAPADHARVRQAAPRGCARRAGGRTRPTCPGHTGLSDKLLSSSAQENARDCLPATPCRPVAAQGAAVGLGLVQAARQSSQAPPRSLVTPSTREPDKHIENPGCWTPGCHASYRRPTARARPGYFWARRDWPRYYGGCPECPGAHDSSEGRRSGSPEGRSPQSPTTSSDNVTFTSHTIPRCEARGPRRDPRNGKDGGSRVLASSCRGRAFFQGFSHAPSHAGIALGRWLMREPFPCRESRI